LPKHAQDIYRAAFNNAWEEYKSPKNRQDPSESREQVAHKVAWAAVEKKYKKSSSGVWELKN
jgi:cation transport regulator